MQSYTESKLNKEKANLEEKDKIANLSLPLNLKKSYNNSSKTNSYIGNI